MEIINRYLFRGKRIHDNEWIVGDLVQGESLYIYNPSMDDGEIYHRIIPTTIGQCTGIFDKSGVLIFEGDIVTDDRGWHGIAVWMDDGRWMIVSRHNRKRYVGYVDKIPSRQIIGNIHDNKELSYIMEED